MKESEKLEDKVLASHKIVSCVGPDPEQIVPANDRPTAILTVYQSGKKNLLCSRVSGSGECKGPFSKHKNYGPYLCPYTCQGFVKEPQITAS